MAKRKTARIRRRRSWGTLRTMRNGSIQASYIADDGRRHYATRTYDTKMDAEGWLANERRLIELGGWTPPANRAVAKAVAAITLRDYADRWLTERDLAPKTRALYQQLLGNRILPVLGDEMLRAITPATVRAWWVGLGKKTPTRNTHAYQLLKTIFNTAVEDKAVTENPCQIKAAGKPPKPRDVQALTPAELVNVAEAAPEAYRAAVPVAAWCGLRFGELIELRRKDVHVSGDHTVLKIRRAATRVDNKLVVGPPKTDAGVRDVTVPPHVAEILRAHMAAHTGGTGGVRLHHDARPAVVYDGVHQGCEGGVRQRGQAGDARSRSYATWGPRWRSGRRNHKGTHGADRAHHARDGDALSDRRRRT